MNTSASGPFSASDFDTLDTLAGSTSLPAADVDVSVVVPTWRRPQMLEHCLTALVSQDFDPARYEIIVCDDGPDRETRQMVARFAAERRARGPAVRYVPVTRTQGPAGARNAGWRAARAPIIAFTDDDTLADRHWLSAGLLAIAQAADAVSGRIVVPLPDRPTDYERDASGLARAEFATANVFVKRALLASTGGFDERFTSAWREDSDLQFTLLKAGARIASAHAAVVVHPVRPARWGVSIAQQKKSQFDALLFRKHPELFRQRIQPSAPRLYYAILCATAVLITGVCRGQHAIALTGAVVWIVLTSLFCATRLRGTRRDWRHVAEMAWTSIPIPFLSVFWRLYGAARYKVFFL